MSSSGELVNPEMEAQYWDDCAGVPSPDLTDVEEEISDAGGDSAEVPVEPVPTGELALQLCPAGEVAKQRRASVSEIAEEASASLARLDTLIEAASTCNQPRILS